MMGRPRPFYIFVLIAFLMTSCGGPRTPLEVVVREFPTDVLFGRRETPPPPPAASNPNPGFPVLVSPPTSAPPRPRPTISPLGPICPQAHPFTAPRHIAEATSEKAPIASTYRFRNDGFSERVDGQGRTTVPYPPGNFRTVDQVQTRSNGSFLYRVIDDFGGVATQTRFEVVPQSPLADQAGVFITQIVLGSDHFTPQPKLKILQFPAENGFEWDAVGTDPLRQTTMSFHGRIGQEVPDGPDEDEEPDLVPKIRVDACGEVLDAWYVDITDGQVIGPRTNLTFKSFYAIATQFGGLTVMEHTELSGTEGSVQVTNIRTATISEEPALPQ